MTPTTAAPSGAGADSGSAPARHAFFVAGTPKAMSVGSSFRFKRNGVDTHIQGRRNTGWSTLVGEIGRQHAPPAPMTGPVVFAARFYVPMPGSLPKKARDSALPVKRPDLDNLVHKLTDQFNGVYWVDDSQVVEIHLSKRYPADGRTGVEIIIEALAAPR